MGQFAAFLPAALNIAGGLFGGDGGVGDANAANAALNRQIRNLFREMGQKEAFRFNKAEGLFQGRADRVLGDLDRAIAGVGSTERNLTRGAVDRASQNTANLKQQLASSGFRNSTIGANLQQGVNSNLESNLAGVASQADRARSGLNQSKAGFRAQVEGDLANLPLRRNASEQNRLNGLVAALQEMSHKAQGGGGGGLGSLLGQLGGLDFGGLFGGGGSLGNSFNLNLDGLNGTFV